MSGQRPWGLTVYRSAIGAPMWSLGVHLDLHTPTLDIHLPWHTVQVGRNNWEGKRFTFRRGAPWNGHSDNCEHPHRALAEPVDEGGQS